MKNLIERSKIVIVKAKEEDREFILRGNEEIDECSYIVHSALAKNIDEDLFKRKKAVCLLARDGQKNIGMALFSKVYWADRGEGIYISQAFVEKDYRGQGVFKLLMCAALNYYKNTNFITCLVAKKNKNMLDCMHKLNFEDEDMISYAKNKSELVKLLRN